jgi:thiol:disulfide interchange protein DsbC
LISLVRALGVVAFSLLPGLALGAGGEAARAAIQRIAPMQEISEFRESALPGYYEGVIAGQVAYASADGRFLLRGTVEDLERGVNLSESSMAAKRRAVLADLGSDARLSFAPADAKYRVTVFTDVDCPFCRRLHARVDEYNALGIAIDYVFFPLSIHPGADVKSIAVWCSADRRTAYSAAVRGAAVGASHCENPLPKMRHAGSEIGVVQTPTAIAADGSVVDATVLMSPQRLLAELQRISTTDPSALAASATGR